MEQNKLTKQKTTRQQAIDRLLEQLPTMDRKALLKLWCDLFDRVPSPALRRETLIPILAYRIQEKAFGGLKESTARKLRELAEERAGDAKLLRVVCGRSPARDMCASITASCTRSPRLKPVTSMTAPSTAA